MPFGVVSGVGRGMSVLDGVHYHRRRRAFLGVNLGCPIVVNGTLLRSCAKVSEPMDMTFGVVSGVGLCIRVLKWGPYAQRKRGSFGFFLPQNCPLVSVAYFCTEMYSICT